MAGAAWPRVLSPGRGRKGGRREGEREGGRREGEREGGRREGEEQGEERRKKERGLEMGSRRFSWQSIEEELGKEKGGRYRSKTLGRGAEAETGEQGGVAGEEEQKQGSRS